MKKDLSNILTVFVISCGKNPNHEDCLKALSEQTVSFKLKHITDVSPLPVAFQKMIDDCDTKYYIEVDEDMVLYKNAIEKMVDHMEVRVKCRDKIAICSCQLSDPHLEMAIYGIKIYCHEILKNYPYDISHPSCEVDQLARLEKDGWQSILYKEPVGEHSPKWTDETIYDRYCNLMRKFSIYKYIWMESLPDMLMNKIAKKPSRHNIIALLGAWQGIMEGKLDKEKNAFKKSPNLVRFLPYIDRPVEATLYMTSSCNHRCGFCVRQHGGIASTQDMTPEMVQTLLIRFPTIRACCLCGFGEPLMSSYLVPVMKFLQDRSLFTSLITNGSLLRNRWKEFCDIPLGYVSVSLNAHDKESHEEITGSKTWNNILEGIKMVLADKRHKLYVSHVLTKNNLKDVPAFLKLMNELDVKTVHLHNVLPHFIAEKNANFRDIVLTKREDSAINELKKVDAGGIVKRWPITIDDSGGRMSCRSLSNRNIQMDGDGNMGLCNSVLPCNAKYGNIKNYVVWNNDGFVKFRDDYANCRIEQCSMCFRNWEVE